MVAPKAEGHGCDQQDCGKRELGGDAREEAVDVLETRRWPHEIFWKVAARFCLCVICEIGLGIFARKTGPGCVDAFEMAQRDIDGAQLRARLLPG